jgi:transcriptional regulator with XRE-family HTH domain
MRYHKYRMAKSHVHPLREYRQEHGLTCDELGKKLGLAGSTVRSYENGHRIIDGDTAVMIEGRIGVSRAKLRSDLWGAEAAA